jgi:hypothetical protein
MVAARIAVRVFLPRLTTVVRPAGRNRDHHPGWQAVREGALVAEGGNPDGQQDPGAHAKRSADVPEREMIAPHASAMVLVGILKSQQIQPARDHGRRSDPVSVAHRSPPFTPTPRPSDPGGRATRTPRRRYRSGLGWRVGA